jgi:hypothetical protein
LIIVMMMHRQTSMRAPQQFVFQDGFHDRFERIMLTLRCRPGIALGSRFDHLRVLGGIIMCSDRRSSPYLATNTGIGGGSTNMVSLTRIPRPCRTLS